MNARELQGLLIEDLDALFSGKLYKTPNHTMEEPKAYPQFLLPRDAQTAEDPFPYIEVRLRSGGIESPTEPHKIKVMLLIGIYDDGTRYCWEPPPEDDLWDDRNFGIMSLMEMIERVQEHYEKHPVLDNSSFCFDGPFYWEVQEEEFFPYYVGICEFSFNAYASRTEGSKYT